MKRCSTCHIEKELSEFYKNKVMKDGYQNVCKSCLRIYINSWEERHKNERIEYQKQYHINNIEVRHARNNAAVRNRYHSDPSYKTKKNQQKKESMKRKREADPIWWEKVRMWGRNSRRRRRIIQSGNGGEHTEQQWLDLCAYFDNCCLRCGEKKPLTQDHVLPVSKGGDDSIENIQPLCKECNSTKNVKEIDYRK